MKKEKDKGTKKKKKDKPAQSPAVLDVAEITKLENEDAILETLLKHIGGKWKIRIIWALQDGKSKRYSNLKSEVSSITDMMLSQSLKELMASEIIERHQYQEIPPRVEYQITKKGLALIPIFREFIIWVHAQYIDDK